MPWGNTGQVCPSLKFASDNSHRQAQPEWGDFARAGVQFVLIGTAHLAFLFLFAAGIHSAFQPSPERDIQVRIIAQSSPEPESAIKLLPADPVVVPTPFFEMEEPQAPAAISSVDASKILPPHIDPTHRNPVPTLPSELSKLASASVVLRVYVQPDGSISEAQVLTSSGVAQLDSFAAAFAKENWRYVPAMIGTRAIADWTTVLMRFAA